MKNSIVEKLCKAILSIAIIVTSITINNVYADTYELLVNNENISNLEYGQNVQFGISNYSENNAKYYYGTEADYNNGNLHEITSGDFRIIPGSYKFSYLLTANMVDYEKRYDVEITKGTIETVNNLKWTGSVASFDAVTKTSKNGTLVSGDLKDYTVQLFKDGSEVKTIESTNETSFDFANDIIEEGAGVYTFTVVANSNNQYLNNSSVVTSQGYVAVEITLDKDAGIESVSPNTSFVLLPGNETNNSKDISYTLKTGYSFENWENNNFTYTSKENNVTTIKVADNYSGDTSVVVTAKSKDIQAPSITSFTKGEGTTLKATVVDNEDGVYEYAFSTKTTLDASELTHLDSAAKEKTFTYEVTAGGEYYFYAVDERGNSTRSTNAIQVTKITYQNYDGKDNSSIDYMIGDTYSLLSPTCKGYTFGGWKDANGNPVTSVSHNTSDGVVLTAIWTKQALTLNVSSDIDKTYDGTNSTISVSTNNTGTLTYTWYKGTDKIDGEETSSITVKDVSDSGTYHVVVKSVDDLGKEQTATSADINVTIREKDLTVTADNKTITYGSDSPTFTASYSGFVNGENTSVLSGELKFGCDYKLSDNKNNIAGTYSITPSGLTGDNYKISFVNGTLTVNAKESDITLTFKNASATYTYDSQNPITPEVVVKDGTIELVKDTDYTVDYTNNNKAGTATVTITLKGNYSGTKSLNYAIEKASFVPTVILNNWTYGETANTPNLSSNDSSGTVTYYYAAKDSNEYSTSQPTQAGTYKVKAVVSETDNYASVTTVDTEFEILKREITITANSVTCYYDGANHADAGYSQIGTFAQNEGFAKVTVTGSITAVGEQDNVIDYTLTSVTNANNYIINKVNGKLTINKVKLTIPSETRWGNTPGKCEWVSVTKPNLTVTYVVKLYAYDGENYTLVKEAETGNNYYDFSSDIRNKAIDGAYTYCFTISTKPTGGADNDYYYDSDTSDYIGSLYTAKVVVGEKATSVDKILLNGLDTAYLIQGESISISASTKPGYTFGSNTWVINDGTGLAISGSRYSYSNDVASATATLKADNLTSSLNTASINVITSDSYPAILSYTATNASDASKVTLGFNVHDLGGLQAYAIMETNDSSANWVTISGTDYAGSVDIAKEGSYKLLVKDTSNNISISSDYLTIYHVQLQPGDTTGSNYDLYKAENTTIKLPENPYIKDGYAFQNWSGVTGLYEDKGGYGENKNDTLKALWTNVHYDYQVNYFYMNLDGTYSSVADSTETFNVLYGTQISYANTDIQKEVTGFTIDSSHDYTLTINSANLTFNLYYARNKYKITYSWENNTTHAIESKTSEEIFYGATLDEKTIFTDEKPQVDGYDFVGWDFGEIGSMPSTMPAQNFTITGELNAKVGKYHIYYYTQNLKNNNTEIDETNYTLYKQVDGITGYHDDVVEISVDTALEIEGFTYDKAYASFGACAGATLPGDASTTISPEIKAEDLNNDLYINIYYSRNNYNVTLRVLDESETVYTTTWTKPYQYAFQDGEIAGYTVYEKSKWKPNHEEYILANYVDYSTGVSAPTVMPAGDVTITREFVKQIMGEYQIEVWMENDVENTYTRHLYNYYGSVGTTITIGNDNTYGFNYNNFKNIIDGFGYYQYKVVSDDLVENNTITGTNLTGGTADSGVITDTNSGEEKLVLRIFFERRSATIYIKYVAIDASGNRTDIADVTKTRKWGNVGSDSIYNVEPLALFRTTADGSWVESLDSMNIYSYGGTTADLYDFRSNGYVVSYMPNWTTYAYVNNNKDARGSVKIETEDGINEASRTDSALYVRGTHQYDLGATSTVTVYYTKVDPNNQYYLDVVANTNNLDHGVNVDVPLTINYNNKDYKVRVTNEAYFYKDAAYVANNYTDYIGLGYYNINRDVSNATSGRFVYDTNGDLKDGFSKITIGSDTYYIDDGYIYIAVTDNRFYYGNQCSYSLPTGSESYGEAYKHVLSILTDYKNTYPDELRAQGAYVYNRSWGSTISYKNSKLTVTYEDGRVYNLFYMVNGVACEHHQYANGSTIAKENISCNHSGIFSEVEGYHIQWYSNAACTADLVDITIKNDNAYVYGNYVKDTYKCYEYAYYELADYVKVGNTIYAYITENDLEAFKDDDKFTQTSSIVDNIETVTYKYDGQVVMIRKDHYNDSFDSISLNPNDYLVDGFKYDEANSSNNITSYVQNKGISLHAYYVRDTYSLLIDYDNVDANNKTTEYRQGQEVKLFDPVKNGYDFAGWEYYKWNVDKAQYEIWTEQTGSTVTIPNCNVKALAKWEAASYNIKVNHFFQSDDLTYDTESVLAMIADENPTNIKVKTLEGTEVAGLLYSNSGISYVKDGETYYFISGTETADVYSVKLEDLSCIRQTLKVTEEAKNNVSASIKTISQYNYSYTNYSSAGTTTVLYEDATYTVKYGMTLDYYYSLQSGYSLSAITKDVKGTNVSLTIFGEGTNYYYGQTVNVSASLPSGYDFVGWYKYNDVISDGKLIENYSDKTAVSTSISFNAKIYSNVTYVAVVSAYEVDTPSIAISGKQSLIYGYKATTENAITANVSFADNASSENYVKSYQWYLNGVKIDQNATSATFLIPEGADVGEYTLSCNVVVARRDNGVEKTFTSDNFVVSISKTAIEYDVNNYAGSYDGNEHQATIIVTKSSGTEIYYSTEEALTKDNYSTKGSTTNPSFTNVKTIVENEVTTVDPTYTYNVYYYIKSLSDNYSDASGYMTVKITPRVVSIEAGETAFTKVYDGKEEVAGSISEVGSDFYRLSRDRNAYHVLGLANNDSVDNYIVDGNAVYNNRHVLQANAITMSNLVLKKTDNSVAYNYIFADNYNITISGNITRREFEITWGTNKFTYDDTDKCPTASIETTLPDKGISVETAGEQKIVGSYTAVASLTTTNEDVDINDYKVTNNTYDFIINPREVKLRYEKSTVTYNGNEHTLSDLIISWGSILETQTLTTTPSASYTNAGSYKVKPVVTKIIDNTTKADVTSNYSITCIDADLVIEKQPVTVSGIQVNDKNYDGNTNATIDLSNITFDEKLEKDTLGLDASKVSAAFENADSGKGKNVTITIASDALTGDTNNYSLDIAKSQTETTAEIKKLKITVTAADVTDAIYGTVSNFSVSYSGFVNNEDENVISNKESITYTIGSSNATYSEKTSAGTYAIHPVITGLSATNYIFENKDGTLKVNLREITVAKNPDSEITKVYDGTTNATVASTDYVFSNIVNNDSVTLTFDAAYNSKDATIADDVTTANKVTLTNLKINNANYKLTTTSFYITGSITKASLTITADNKTITYGDAAPTYTETYSGFVNNETKSVLSGTLSIGSTYNTGKDETRKAGDNYVIEIGGYTSSNYEIAYTNGKLTVNKKELTVYPTAAKTASDLTVVDARTKGNVTRIYGHDLIPEWSYGIEGFVYNEDASVLTSTTVTYSVDSNLTTFTESGFEGKISAVAGTYKVEPVVTAMTDENYSFKAAAGYIKVEKYTINISGVVVNSKEYDGTTNVFSNQFDLTNLVITDLLQVDRDYFTKNSTAAKITVSGVYDDPNVGSRTVNLTIGLADYLSKRCTYVIGNIQKTATSSITMKKLTVTANAKSVVYGSAIPTYSATFSGLTNNETADDSNVTISGNYVATSGSYSEVGDTYTITPSNFIDTDTTTAKLNNYDVEYITNKLTVTQATLATPTNVKWDTANPGTITFNAVSGIGDVTVSGYEVSLYKDGTLVENSTFTTTNLSYNYASLIHSTGAGKYTVKVKAIASTTYNENKKNVLDSGYATSDNVYAANVSFVFASDAISQAARKIDENDNPVISINNASSYVMIAGESDIPISATLKNATGYTVKSVTCSDNLTVGTATFKDQNYSNTVSLSSNHKSGSDLTITLALDARPATLAVTVTPRPGDSQARTTYGYAKGPTLTATVAVNNDDNITTSDYTYSYKWEIREGYTTMSIDDSATTSAEIEIPRNLNANTSLTHYQARCIVTATRKDNGQSITIGNYSWNNAESYVTNFSIDKAKFTASVALAGWTYGETHSTPVLTTDGATAKQNPKINTPIYKYVSKSIYDTNNNTDAWSTEMPTDAGIYYIRATIPEDTNYISINSNPTQFEISKNKLATPTGLTMTNSTKASYGLLSWNAVSGYDENNNVDPKSHVTVTYEVVLYKKENESFVSKKTYSNLSTTTLDVTDDMQTFGEGDYEFGVIAISSNTTNCENSDEATYTANFNIDARLVIDNKVYTTEENKDKTKTFDNVAYVLGYQLINANSLTVKSQQWYKNGVAISSATGTTLSVIDVADSAYYNCAITLSNDSIVNTPITKITIEKKDVTLTSSTATKVYDGTALTNNEVTSSGFAKDNGATYNVTGTVTNVSEESNTFTYTLDENTKADNYKITVVYGKLSITPRSLKDNSSQISFSSIDAVTYSDTAYTPTPTVTDTGLATGVETTLTESDFTYSYTDNVNAGTATVTITGQGNYKDTTSTKFTINKRAIKFTGQIASETYTGSELSITGVTNDTLVSGHSSNVEYLAKGTEVNDYTGSITAATAVKITRTSDKADVTDNYTITTELGKLTISKTDSDWSINLDNDTYTYDSAAHYINKPVSSTAKTGTTSYEYSFDENGTYVTDLTSLTKVNADTYNIYVKATNPNYSKTATKTVTLTIKKIKLNVYTEGTKVFNGADQKLEITSNITSGTPVEYDVLTIKASITGHNAGTYQTIDGNSSYTVVDKNSNDVTANYDVTITGELVITQRSLADNSDKISISDIAAVIYADKAYTPTPTVTDTGLATKVETILTESDFTYSYTNNVNAGTATVTITGQGNYKESTSTTFTINKRPISFTGITESKEYTGSAITLSTFETTADALLSGHTSNVSYSATGIEVGSYLGTITAIDKVKITKGDVEVTSNYDITTTAGTLTITQTDATWTVSLDNDEYTYNASAYYLNNTPTSGAATGTTTFTYSFTEDSGYVDSLSSLTKVDAGTYTIYVKGTNLNYLNASSIATATLTIKQRAITITGDSGTVTYDNQNHSINTYKTSKLVDGHNATIEYLVSGKEANASGYVGSFTGSATIKDASNNDVTANYAVTTEVGKLIINKTTVAFTISLADTTVTYDAASHCIANTPTSEALSGTTTYEYKFEDDSNYVSSLSSLTKVDAGTYKVDVKATNPNYQNAATTSANLVINQKALTITGDSKTVKYNDAEQNVKTFTSSGLIDGHSIDMYYLAAGTTVGTYTGSIGNIIVKSKDATDVTKNYNISSTVGTLTIEKSEADWTVQLVNDSTVYDGQEHNHTKSATSSDKSGVTSFTYSLEENGTYVTDLSSLKMTNAGSYQIYVKATNPNYTKEATHLIDADNPSKYIINQRPVTFTGKTINDAVYNSSEISSTTISIEGLVSGHTHNVTYCAKGTEAGTYTGTITNKDAVVIMSGNNDVTSNYAIVTTAGSLTINPTSAAWSISLSGKDYTYDDKAHSLTVLPTSTAKTGTTTYSYSFEQDKNYTSDLASLTKVAAGTYTIYVKATNPNYSSEANTTATLKIDKAKVSFVGKSAEETYTGSDIEINDIDITGLIEGHTHNVTYSVKGKEHGIYDGTITSIDNVVIKDALDNVVTSNYNITTSAGKLEIKPTQAEWHVTLNNKEYIYDGQNHSLTDVATSDAKSGVTTYKYCLNGESTYTNDLTELVKKDAGTYTIYVEAENDDYTHVATSSATLTIKKRKVTVTADNKEKIYLDTDPELTYVIQTQTADEGLLDNETLTDLTIQRALGENHGEYDITVTQQENVNLNYDVTFVKGVFTINKLDITDGSFNLVNKVVYNGESQQQLINNVKSKDLKSIETSQYTISGDTQKEIGEYQITVTGTDNCYGSIVKKWELTSLEEIKKDGKYQVNLVKKNEVPDTTLNNPKEEVALSVANAEELVEIKNGKELVIWIELEHKEEDKVNEKLINFVNNRNYADVYYLEINMFKKLNSAKDPDQIFETDNLISLSIEVPDSLINQDNSVNREYYVIREHLSNVEFINATYDKEKKCITIWTDKFSDYAIAYSDKKIHSHTVVNTSDNSNNISIRISHGFTDGYVINLIKKKEDEQ